MSLSSLTAGHVDVEQRERCSLVRRAGGIKDGYSTAAGGSTVMETDLIDLRRPRRTGAIAVGALALGAFAVGALAIGALTIGRLTVRRLRVRRSHLRALRIDDLDVGTLRVRSLHMPEKTGPAAPAP
jgi:hypothetical protein